MTRTRTIAIIFSLVALSLLAACGGSSEGKDNSLRDSLELVKSQLLDIKNAEAREQADKQRHYDDSLLDAHPKAREWLDDFEGGLGTDVYICTGTRSRHFHTLDDCPSLNRCTGDIEEVELREAIAKNRKRCKLCEYVEYKMEDAINQWSAEHDKE